MTYELFKTVQEYNVDSDLGKNENLISYLSRKTKIPLEKIKSVIEENSLAVLLNNQSIAKDKLETTIVSEKDRIIVLPVLVGG